MEDDEELFAGHDRRRVAQQRLARLPQQMVPSASDRPADQLVCGRERERHERMSRPGEVACKEREGPERTCERTHRPRQSR
jgi:hypothetical protein